MNDQKVLLIFLLIFLKVGAETTCVPGECDGVEVEEKAPFFEGNGSSTTEAPDKGGSKSPWYYVGFGVAAFGVLALVGYLCRCAKMRLCPQRTYRKIATPNVFERMMPMGSRKNDYRPYTMEPGTTKSIDPWEVELDSLFKSAIKLGSEHSVAIKMTHPHASDKDKSDLQQEIEFMKTLDDKLVQSDLIPLAWQVCDALTYLSSRNMIHRDVAARNVLLTNEKMAKLSDFGLCRLSSEMFYTTRGGKLPIKWMAPESLETAVFSEKTDVWSFGVFLFEKTLVKDCDEFEPLKRPNFQEIRQILYKLVEDTAEQYGYLEFRKTYYDFSPNAQS
ncbi:unnamed protein product, partial [Mesorhabditis belari]|uniref:Protein kinase domain-containing protein n=1 Tax=Mesorhabditis belari TaxID=2138241 RepID=A0AAF3FJU9_9BILA